MAGDENAPQPEEHDGSEHRTLRFVRPFFEDSTLWPVLIVAVVSATLFGATLLLVALAGRNLFALAALVILVWMSVDSLRQDWKRRRGFSLLGRGVLGLWALSAAAAGAAVMLKLY